MRMVDEALDLPETERAAFLEREAAGDSSLLARARRMLDAAGHPSAGALDGSIESAIGAAAASALADHPSHPGRIGPYAVQGVLGEGGMGIVLRARQDEPIARDVAIKLIRAGVHAPTVIARFQAERQTLASLVHPNIAELYDAGTTPDGLPYFVMELIGGEPITEYCDRKRLGLDERLALFRTLLGAVQHAHQRAIVHRDLKPSNVLVTEVDGRPVLKVIDFGIAGVEGPEPGLTRLTTVGSGIGTVEYMSPEQLLHPMHGADTRSDIYSLGVLLYELVSGRLPIEADKLRLASPSELERLLMRTPVPRPSRRTSEDARERLDWARARAADARTLSGRLRGDLDTIVEVAMATDPARRYSTVARLDDDLAAFLAGRPITARPQTLAYRARKFVARNAYAVGGSAAATVILVAMGVVFTVRLAGERDRATLEAERATQVAGFLESLFEAPDPFASDAANLSAREMLDAGATRLQEELADQPEVQSTLLGAIGRTYAGLGLWDEAERLLRSAIDINARIDGDEGERANLLVTLGVVLADRGEASDAEESFREALALRTRTLGPGHPETAAVLGRLSLALRGRGEYEAAERHGRQAVALLRESGDSLELAQALHSLAFTLRSRAALAESERLYREAVAIRTAILDPAHPELIQTMNNLSLVLEAQGRYAEAEAMSEQVLDARRERLGADHPLTLQSLNNLAYVHWRIGRYARATELFEESVARTEAVYPGDSQAKAIGLNNLAVAKHRVGALEEAEAAARSALAMDLRLNGREHPRIAGDMINLGRILVARGKLEEADSLHVAAVAMQEQLFGRDHPDRADGLSALAATRIEMGRSTDAIALLDEALRVRMEALGAENPRTAQTLHDLGLALAELGRTEEAAARLGEALAVRTAELGETHPETVATLVAVAHVQRTTGRFAEARATLEDATDRLDGTLDPSDPHWEHLRAERAALDSVAGARAPRGASR